MNKLPLPPNTQLIMQLEERVYCQEKTCPFLADFACADESLKCSNHIGQTERNLLYEQDSNWRFYV